MHVAFSSTMNAVAGVEAAIRSIQEHALGPVQFYFIGKEPLPSSPDLPNTAIHWFNLSQVAQEYNLIEYMNVGFEGRDDKINIMYANYARFAVPDLFERYVPNATKVLYLDTDVIVLCDVHSLVQNALSDEAKTRHPVAAVARYATPREKNPIRGIHPRSKKKLREEFGKVSKSFNAGVYIVHVERWRDHNISNRVRELALRNRKEQLYIYGSQPPLNLIIGENFQELPSRWNSFPSDYERYQNGDRTEQVCLIHYKGGIRPWANKEDYRAKDVWLRYGTQVDVQKRLMHGADLMTF